MRRLSMPGVVSNAAGAHLCRWRISSTPLSLKSRKWRKARTRCRRRYIQVARRVPELKQADNRGSGQRRPSSSDLLVQASRAAATPDRAHCARSEFQFSARKTCIWASDQNTFRSPQHVHVKDRLPACGLASIFRPQAMHWISRVMKATSLSHSATNLNPSTSLDTFIQTIFPRDTGQVATDQN